MKSPRHNDYSTVTELPGTLGSSEQLARMLHRYETANRFSQQKDVLEVACGAGQGLGYLTKTAKSVVGADCSETLLRLARDHYQSRTKLVRLDAEALPFRDRSFDVIILFEAIYYLDSPEKFLEECSRLLREGGVLLVCTVNKEWAGFYPSPFSKRYFTASELAAMAQARKFDAEVLGAFPDSPATWREKVLWWLRRIAVASHLIPRTMRGKTFLKRIFSGKLLAIPNEIQPETLSYVPPVPVLDGAAGIDYKILYVVARAR